MGIFGNIYVGGLPNIKMAVPLPTTELKFPSYADVASYGSASSKTAATKNAADDITALYGDKIDYLNEEADIKSAWNSIYNKTYALVEKYDGDTTRIQNDSEYIDEILPQVQLIKQYEIQHAANKNALEKNYTTFYENMAAMEKGGTLDSWYTEQHPATGAEMRIGYYYNKDEGKSKKVYEYGNAYIDADTGKEVKDIEPTFMTNRDYFTQRFAQGYKGGLPLAGTYGRQYTVGTLDTEINQQLTQAAAKMPGGGGYDEPVENKLGLFMKDVQYGTSNKDNLDAAVKYIKSELDEQELYEAKQQWWSYKNMTGDNTTTFDEWLGDKVQKMAIDLYSYTGGTTELTPLEGGIGAGIGTAAQNMPWMAMAVLGKIEGSHLIYDALSAGEKKTFDTDMGALKITLDAELAAGTITEDEYNDLITEGVQKELSNKTVYADLHKKYAKIKDWVYINGYYVNPTAIEDYKKAVEYSMSGWSVLGPVGVVAGTLIAGFPEDPTNEVILKGLVKKGLAVETGVEVQEYLLAEGKIARTGISIFDVNIPETVGMKTGVNGMNVVGGGWEIYLPGNKGNTITDPSATAIMYMPDRVQLGHITEAGTPESRIRANIIVDEKTLKNLQMNVKSLEGPGYTTMTLDSKNVRKTLGIVEYTADEANNVLKVSGVNKIVDPGKTYYKIPYVTITASADSDSFIPFSAQLKNLKSMLYEYSVTGKVLSSKTEFQPPEE